MITGTERRGFLRALVALAMLPVRESRAQDDWTLERLMRGLAQVRSARARFVEKRYLAMLRTPIESMGVLVYQAPNRLEKRVEQPKPERMLLENEQLTLESGAKQRTLRLADHPELTALVGSLRATLAGDVGALERHFHAELEGPEERWRLRLIPIEKKIAALIKFIRIFGTGAELTAVEVQQADGDRSVMMMTRDAT